MTINYYKKKALQYQWSETNQITLIKKVITSRSLQQHMILRRRQWATNKPTRGFINMSI